MCQNMCSHGSERADRLPCVWLKFVNIRELMYTRTWHVDKILLICMGVCVCVCVCLCFVTRIYNPTQNFVIFHCTLQCKYKLACLAHRIMTHNDLEVLTLMGNFFPNEQIFFLFATRKKRRVIFCVRALYVCVWRNENWC